MSDEDVPGFVPTGRAVDVVVKLTAERDEARSRLTEAEGLLRRGVEIARKFAGARDSDDELAIIHELCNWAGQVQDAQRSTSSPPAPVDPVEAPTRLRDDADLEGMLFASHVRAVTSRRVTTDEVRALLDAIEVHLAHHTATSEQR